METKSYSVPRSLSEAAAVRLPCALWGTEPPETLFRCAYTPEETLYVQLRCMEKAPRMTFREEDAFVHQDSCMECFFRPDGFPDYINMEANAFGALRCGVGSERKGRRLLSSLPVVRPACEAAVAEESWEVLFTVSQDLFSALYPGFRLVPGAVIHANFYKCGDQTPAPHYGAWQSIPLPAPDFHRPEFFGSLILL